MYKANNNMKSCAMLEVFPQSSQNGTCHNPSTFENANSYKQFQDAGRNVMATVPMDYEYILNSQTEEDENSKPSPASKTNVNEIVDCEVGCTDTVCTHPFYSIYSGIDVGFNVITKENGSSCIGQDEDFVMKLKLEERNYGTDNGYEISQRQKGQLNSAVSEIDEKCCMSVIQEDEHSGTDKCKNAEVSCNTISNSHSENMGNVSSGKDCDTAVRFQQKSCNSDSNSINNDTSIINTWDTDEETKSGIKHILLWKGDKSGNKCTPGKKYSVVSQTTKTSLNLKYETHTYSNSEEADGDLKIPENWYFVNQPKKNCSSFGDDCGKLSQDGGNIKGKTDQSDTEAVLNNKIYGQSLQLLKDGSAFDCPLDSFNDKDCKLLTPLSEQNLQEQTTYNNKEKFSSSVFLSSKHATTVLSSEDFDSLDGLYPVHTFSDSSGQQMQRQTVKGCLDTGHAQSHYKIKLMNVKSAADSTQTSSLLGYHGISSVSEDQNCSKKEPGLNCETQNLSSDKKIVLTKKTPPPASASPASVIPTFLPHYEASGKSCSEMGFTLSISGSLSHGKIKGLDHPFESDGSIVPAQNLQTPSHSPSSGGNQHSMFPHAIIYKVTDACSSAPSPHSAHSLISAETGISTASAHERLVENTALPATQISLAAETLTSHVQVSASTSGFSPRTAFNEKHIRSVFSNYASFRLKTDTGCDNDINDIADEFELIFKSSRKRSHVTNSPNISPTKRPNLVGSSFTTYPRAFLEKSKMDVDTVDRSLAWLPITKKKTVQDQEAAVLMCTVCDTSNSSSKSVHCKNAHVICQSCLEDEIRLLMASEKIYLSCPEKSCKAAITLDSLSSVLPPLVVDLLNDNLRLKEQKASAKAVKKMQGLVICPRCSCPGLMDEGVLQFLCASCKSSCCRYCKATWSLNDEHEGCFLLSFVGTECFKHITKLPLNWELKITPFNKVNVPLTSNEGAIVAAFFAKTASVKSQVVQIFRIQNRKLWQKYVLKRRHVEEEIGAAELKEKFLFHGTKAENVVNICGEGFDMRVPTANGAVLGKGIYFSTTARYSEKYADKSGMLFLARVICGWSQHGQRQMTRPQYHSTSRRMFDSCVDSVISPTMYTVFDNTQCYPEYLIQFSI